MKNVNEVALISGVSVRTLHYYDSIGLLSPTERTGAGYRLYDDAAIEKLKTILIFKELEFPLEKIKELLTSNKKDDIIKSQIELLKQKKKHLENLINLAENIYKENCTMDFSAFDKEKLKEYDKEAEEKWGDTKEYAEYKAKENPPCSIGFMQKFASLGSLIKEPIESETVKKAIFGIKDYISENYYACSNEIFLSLGEMYVKDERFKKNIDSAGGKGTAEFANKAIKYYFDSEN